LTFGRAREVVQMSEGLAQRDIGMRPTYNHNGGILITVHSGLELDLREGEGGGADVRGPPDDPSERRALPRLGANPLWAFKDPVGTDRIPNCSGRRG
jgi:hypothetical protein